MESELFQILETRKVSNFLFEYFLLVKIWSKYDKNRNKSDIVVITKRNDFLFSCEWNSIETKRKLNRKQFINENEIISIPMKFLINCCVNRDIELNLVTKKRREREGRKEEKEREEKIFSLKRL